MRMDNRRVYEDDRSTKLMTGFTTSAINVQYAAFADDRNVWIYDNSKLEHAPVKICHGNGKQFGCLVLALSPVPCHLLALAKGYKTFIFDVHSGSQKLTLRGNGHGVTTIHFSPRNLDLIATGAADGSVCVWSLNNVFQPLYCLHGKGSACCSLSFNLSDSDFLTVGCVGEVHIWDVRSSTTASVPVKSRRTADMLLNSAADIDKTILVSKRGLLEVWDMQYLDADRESSLARSGKSDDDPRDFIIQQDKISEFSCITSLRLSFALLQVELIGTSGLVVLPENGSLILFYLISAGHTSIAEVWRLPTNDKVHAMTVQLQQSQALLVAYGTTGIQTYEIPGSICDHLGWNDEIQDDNISGSLQEQIDSLTNQQKSTMVPEPIPQSLEDGVLYKSNRKEFPSQHSLMKTANNRTLSRPSTAQSTTRTEIFDLPPLADSFDLPAPGAMAKSSFMPFLSPSIPASRELPMKIVGLNESLHLPPLARGSFNSTATDNVNDSDSDDDEISGPLISSGTLLPGGVNVPLPRTCGAFFGPSGHLIVFLPCKSRPASVTDEPQLPDPSPNASPELEVTRLFPTFGNLTFVPVQMGNRLSDSESIISTESEIAETQRLGLQPSFFDSRHRWNVKVQPAPAKVGPLLSETKIRVGIYDATGLSSLRKDLAREYRLSCREDETRGQLCLFNAERATKAGLSNVTDIWTTLSLSLQMSDSISARPNDSLTLTPPALSGFPFGYSHGSCEPHMRPSDSVAQAHGSLLEIAWVIRKLINWAERQGDVQTLTCIAVIVLVSWDKIVESNQDGSIVYSQSKAPRSADLENNIAIGRGDMMFSTSSLLRPTVPEQGHVNGSSAKVAFSSASSRDPSQPPTPYLQSALSTPPLGFSTSSRRNTRLSTPGSTSPEHSRSSFSAAAKYYAQSITDKFASYGTSPPVKKTGTSPSLELSSSLPTTSGSWTKSVSFASVSNTATDPRDGLGITNDNGDSDSNKTIDENSHSHTPKSLDLGVPILWHQKHETGGIQSESSETSRILKEIQAKSRIWYGYYAERLRAWDMMFEATELEKVGDLADTASLWTGDFGSAVQPHSIAGKKYATCSICYCLIQAAQQGCPTCGHTTHPRCMVGYLENQVLVEFTCPTGCGCNCTLAQEATFTDAALIARDLPGPGSRPGSKVMKKRASLTDPRRARARLEGESW